ncbi:hypothetical protein SDC9_129321 [bioreactor metagenome]|uniref:Uncharacterized protein n=1 Tax=bioreactor metagenome TaxID=1076179 RepID=A0A645CYH3_9ZZZZ
MRLGRFQRTLALFKRHPAVVNLLLCRVQLRFVGVELQQHSVKELCGRLPLCVELALRGVQRRKLPLQVGNLRGVSREGCRVQSGVQLTALRVYGGLACVELVECIRPSDLIIAQSLIVCRKPAVVLRLGVVQRGFVFVNCAPAVVNLLLCFGKSVCRVVQLLLRVGFLRVVFGQAILIFRFRVADLRFRVRDNIVIPRGCQLFHLHFERVFHLSDRMVICIAVDFARRIRIFNVKFRKIVRRKTAKRQIDKRRDLTARELARAALHVEVCGGVRQTYDGVCVIGERIQRVFVILIGD